MLSFILILKDFVYCCCYTGNLFYTGKVKNTCSTKIEGAGIYFIIILFPICFRIMMEFNMFIRCKIKKDHHSIFHFINFLKYVVYLINYCLNFLTKFYSQIIIVWIIVAGLSTIFSYLWDVTYDWGFFKKNSKNKFLRNDLAYPSKIFYYSAIVINFVLRMGWLLLLSPTIVDKLALKKTVLLFISVME